MTIRLAKPLSAATLLGLSRVSYRRSGELSAVTGSAAASRSFKKPSKLLFSRVKATAKASKARS